MLTVLMFLFLNQAVNRYYALSQYSLISITGVSEAQCKQKYFGRLISCKFFTLFYNCNSQCLPFLSRHLKYLQSLLSYTDTLSLSIYLTFT